MLLTKDLAVVLTRVDAVVSHREDVAARPPEAGVLHKQLKPNIGCSFTF